MKYFSILLIACLLMTACTKKIDHNLMLEGNWVLVANEKDGENIYTGTAFKLTKVFTPRDMNNGVLTTAVEYYALDDIDRFIDEYEMSDDGKTLIRRHNSYAVHHEVISLTETELILRYALTTGVYVEYFERN